MVVYCDFYEVLCYYIRSLYIRIANEINLQSMYAERDISLSFINTELWYVATHCSLHDQWP